MDLPQPPNDEELRNIIEKLAVFVARNGQEFEAMTKQKQQNNPRFQFLFGGEFYNYYMYRVTAEQAVLKHRQQGGKNEGPPGNFPFGQHHPLQHQSRFLSPQQQQQQQQQMFERQQQQQPFEHDGFERRHPPPPGAPPHLHRQPNFEGNRHPRPNFDNNNQQQMYQNFEQQQQGMRNQHLQQQQQQFMDNNPNNRNMPNFQNQGPGPGGFLQQQHQMHQQQERPPHLQQMQQKPNFVPPNQPSPHHIILQQQQQQQQQVQQMQQQQNFVVQQQNEMKPPAMATIQQQPTPTAIVTTVLPTQLTQPSTTTTTTLILTPNTHTPQITTQQVLVTTAPAAVNNLEILKAQKISLEEQVRQSEANLAGQQQLLLTQQQAQIEEAIRSINDVEIRQLSMDLNIDLDEFERILEPIVENCTKDSISNGKAWIFTHTSTKRHYYLLTSFLMKKYMYTATSVQGTFNERLHIIYLINDVLHHCGRKGAEDLQEALENMVIPMFCYTKVSAESENNEEDLNKLNKLFNLWESKSNYVSSTGVELLRNYKQTWLEYKKNQLNKHALIVTQISNTIQQTFEGYQNQHQIFCQHALNNIKQIEQQIQQSTILLQQQQIKLQQQMQCQVSSPINSVNQNQPQIPLPIIISTGYPGQPQQGIVAISSGNDPSATIPDLSHLCKRPPPGFSDLPPGEQPIGQPIPLIGQTAPISDRDLMPGLPYYELPAGLMVSLVKLEDDNYRALVPEDIRLPPPCPPTDRLLAAVEAFYSIPSHERPRDSEGWERLGLYEYFKSKNLARKQKEDDIREKRREKSRSPTPIRRSGGDNHSSPCRSPQRKRYQSKSPTQHSKRSSRRSRSKSPRRRSKRKSSRSRSRSPNRRSPTPPQLGLGGGETNQKKIDESNKGHQLLKKMGWGGTGLGLNEQGIENPISGGELREKRDLYKGVGISMHDPFESFRRTKGQAFVERMRQRANPN